MALTATSAMFDCATFVLVETQLRIIGEGGIPEALRHHFRLWTISDIGVDTNLVWECNFGSIQINMFPGNDGIGMMTFNLDPGAIGLTLACLDQLLRRNRFPHVPAQGNAYQSCMSMNKAQVKPDFIPRERHSNSNCGNS